MSTEMSRHLVRLFKFTRVDRLQKPQTHLSTDALIVRLMGRSVVLYRNVVSEISHQFHGRSQITETVEIHDAVVPLRVGHPVSTGARRIVQIHDTALASTRTARR